MNNVVQSEPGSPTTSGVRRGVSLVQMKAAQGTPSSTLSVDWRGPATSLSPHDCAHQAASPMRIEDNEMEVYGRAPCCRQQPHVPVPVPMPAQAQARFGGRHHCPTRPRPRLALPTRASAAQRDMRHDFAQAVASPRCSTLFHSHRNKPHWRRVPLPQPHSPVTLQSRPQKLSEDEYAF